MNLNDRASTMQRFTSVKRMSPSSLNSLILLMMNDLQRNYRLKFKFNLLPYFIGSC